ncbi:MAG: hypothetical protein ACJAVK_002097 [Akkermansiaceae bacterium]|jgi:hypothetical protein
MTMISCFSRLFQRSFLILATQAAALPLPEVRITEFLSRNDEGFRDEDGDRSDWIEIWNASGLSGDLCGWFLTDDPKNLRKWTFPASELLAGERFLVFASDKNRQPITGELHTNFKISSAAGSYLALVRPDGLTIASEFSNYPLQVADISYGVSYAETTPLTLVNEGDTARWIVPSSEKPGWQDLGFDDAPWFTGTTGIGYDFAGDYNNHLGTGDDLGAAMRNINPSVFIRIPFALAAPTGNDQFLLRLKWEDGFVAFLNGQEIARGRAPANLTWQSRSDPTGGRNEDEAVTYFDYPVPKADLRSGVNVLAIHGLNQSPTSSDFLISPLLETSRQPLEDFQTGFFTTPTPSALNAPTQYAGLVADTEFSIARGVFTAAFDLEISTATPEAIIRYTTDGSPPSETSGTIYSTSIRINKTTVVRAIAYRENFFSTSIDSHTYLFPADIVTQPAMRSVITEDATWGPQMLDSLNALPSVSFSFAGNDINRTEIPVSMEFLNFENGSRQADAGAVRVGGFFTDYEKHSFRLHFRADYGEKRFDYPVFAGRTYPTQPVETFDALDFRAGNQDMIHRGAYLSNHFADDSLMAMGQPSPHGRFVHIYFNGEYRGLYHLRERFHAAMFEDYFAGEEEEYTTIDGVNRGNQFSDGVLQNGNFSDWSEIINALDGPSPYQDVLGKLNLENLIDFMLLWTSGSCESEFRSVGSPDRGVPFAFHMKDADGFLRPPELVNSDPRNRFTAFVHPVTQNGPADAMSNLLAQNHPDFKTLLADRIHRHFFNNGALSPAQHIARLQYLVDQARLPYLAEAARWGSHDGTPNRNPNEWEDYQQDILEKQFPGLAAKQVAKLRNAGMYPDLDAPKFSQHGGTLPTNSGLRLSAYSGDIYYTLDGSDPRLPGGIINPNALLATFDLDFGSSQDFILSGDSWSYLSDGSDQHTAWRGAAFDDSSWPTGPSELGYGEGDEMTDIGFVDADPEAGGTQRNATSYFRKSFQIPDPSVFTRFRLLLKYDDAAAVYLNGIEVIRTDNLPEKASYNTYATSSTPDESAYFDFLLPIGSFSAGPNIIAVEIHNASSNSGDLSFDLELTGEPSRDLGNITLPLFFKNNTTLSARSYDDDTSAWSALNQAFFVPDAIPVTAGKIVISEFHYHPTDPLTPSEVAVSSDQDDFEFIEILNIDRFSVSLNGLFFSDGITFSFPEDTLLAAGERIVLVRNFEAFTARYGDKVRIGGQYSGKLSNTGERIALETKEGPLLQFSYRDSSPWPSLADGRGPSLFLSSPALNPTSQEPSNWQAHPLIHGNPGGADQSPGFAEWMSANDVLSPDEDLDRDGLPALLEYALGESPMIPRPSASPQGGITSTTDNHFATLRFNLNPFATDLIIEMQSSTDLNNWENAAFTEIEPGLYRSDVPIKPSAKPRFFRVCARVR